MENQKPKNTAGKPSPSAKGAPEPKKSAAPQHPRTSAGWDNTKKAATVTTSTLGKIVGKILTYALNVFLTLMLIGIITVSAMACALAMYIKNYVDPTFDIENLKYDSSLTTTLYYKKDLGDGNTEWVEWEEERIYGTENRMWVSYDEMPEDLINAFVSIEDKRFFVHNGVDTRRTFGAVLGFLTGDQSYGGSTITQQLIKNVTGDDDVTIQRKIQEILRAFNLEKQRDKKEILEMYLNTIYLSKGCYGVAAAANKYFDKDVSQLTLTECAALASIPQNPSRFDPVEHPEANAERREIVLNEMYYNDSIDKTYTLDEVRDAKAQELVLATTSTQSAASRVHSWFVDTVIGDVVQDLQNTYKEYDEQMAKNLLYSGGLKIYLTIDRDIQASLDAIYNDPANFPTKGTGVEVESAMTIIEQSTGNIVAIIGGRGEKTTPLGFNRATMAKRQPGSAIKPLGVYSQALDKKLINYSTVVDDTPFTIKGNTTWPNNYNFRYDGLTTVYDAVRNSKNTVAVKILDMIGVQRSYDFMVNKFHFTTLDPQDMDYAPLALGGFTYGVTTREMANAYAAIANSGIYNHSRTYEKVLDSHDNILLDNAVSPEVIFENQGSSAVMTKLLQDVVATGTGAPLTLKNKIDCACKTGTTQNNNDLYFCGYTPYYTAACWVGYDIAKSLSGWTGGQRNKSAALFLWDAAMTAAHEKILAAGNVARFTDKLTKGLISRTYCADSGLLPGDACGLDLRGKRGRTGWYYQGNVPTATCDVHVAVQYCKDTNCVAGPNCENTRTVSLIRVNRSFEIPITVVDAQYTYADVPAGVRYPMSTKLAFYANLYSGGRYPGTSKTDKPANAYCSLHNPELCQ